jgi:adenosylcobinamide-phosphate synthase
MNLVLIAYLVEAAFSYPGFLYAAIKHPVVWMGAVIELLDKNCNKQVIDYRHPALVAGSRDTNPDRGFCPRPRNKCGVTRKFKERIAGIAAMTFLLATTLAVSLFITYHGGDLLQIIAMASLFATRNLYNHVKAVYVPLKAGNLPQARSELAKIVGRDVENLDESGINRASIESLAESFCDGVVAPVFYAACFGLPGIACYKAINTADSMIGHKTTRHINFGWAAARLDDAANFIPSRISAGLIAIASISRAGHALKTAWHDARNHASPNSGYPEAAMAGALGVCLGGSRSYEGEDYHAPLIGGIFRKEITTRDLRKALDIYLLSCGLIWILLLLYQLLTNN